MPEVMIQAFFARGILMILSLSYLKEGAIAML